MYVPCPPPSPKQFPRHPPFWDLKTRILGRRNANFRGRGMGSVSEGVAPQEKKRELTGQKGNFLEIGMQIWSVWRADGVGGNFPASYLCFFLFIFAFLRFSSFLCFSSFYPLHYMFTIFCALLLFYLFSLSYLLSSII